jgi:hypothetical protein
MAKRGKVCRLCRNPDRKAPWRWKHTMRLCDPCKEHFEERIFKGRYS